MNRDEARLILEEHTLTGGEAPEVNRELIEAREFLAQDPALSEWFTKRRLGDEAIARALGSVAAPQGLRERLLKLERPGQRPSSIWVRRELILAVAAGIVVGVSVLFWRSFHPTSTTWESDALAQVRQVDSGKLPLDRQTDDFDAIKQFLEGKGSPIPGDLPANLIANSRLGCKVIRVKGLKAAIVCFEISPGLAAHLVVLDVGPDISEVPVGHPVFAYDGNWHTASWSDGKKTYMLGTRAGMDKLKELFG